MNNIWVLGLLFLLLTGCGAFPKKGAEALPLAVPAQVEGQWYAVHFYHDWPEGRSPLWHRDALLAHEVLLPVLRRYQQALPLWRFHRRAARDAAGHRLRFIFYADKATAQSIQQALSADPLLRALQQRGWLKKVRHAGFGKQAQRLSATSDPHWSPAVQAAWPHFIMGVSRTWLELIAAEVGPLAWISDLDALDQGYKEVDAQVSQTWRDQGQHAFFHHLSAVYGYKALEVRY